MTNDMLVEFTQRGLLLAVWVTLPAVLTAVAVGLLFAVVQAATQLQDQTTSSVAKLLAAAAVIALTARWLGGTVLTFTEEMWRAGGFHAATPGL